MNTYLIAAAVECIAAWVHPNAINVSAQMGDL